MQEYTRTDQTLHQLAQLLAKAGRSFVPQQEDDSHTNLYFDAMGQRLLTHPFEATGHSLAFSLFAQSFEWVDEQRQTHFITKLAGQTYQQLEDLLAGAIKDTGLDADAFREDLHFDIPEYEAATKPIVPFDNEALGTWRYYRRLANQVGAALLGYLEAEGQARIWPHHFDTGTYAIIAEKMGIGYGLAMEDGMVGAPYFYLSGYPQNGEVDYDKTLNLSAGRWKVTENWKGAVLPLTDLPPRHAMRVITQFVREATDWYLQAAK